MSRINVDEIKPDTTNGSLSLKGDSGGSATANGISVDSNGNTSITGNVGLGTSAPSSRIDINETSGTAAFRIRDDSSESDAVVFEITPGDFDTNGTNKIRAMNSTGLELDVFGPNNLSFKTNNVERMRVDSTGQRSAVVPSGSTLFPAYECRAWVNFNGRSNSNLTGAYSWSSNTVTITIVNHGLKTNNVANLNFSGTAFDGSYYATVLDEDTFTIATSPGTETGTVTLNRNTIRSSGNVSSVTDSAAGSYFINFENFMPDTNYSVVGTCLGGSEGGSNYVIFGGKSANSSNTKGVGTVQVTTCYVANTSGGGSLYDHQDINVAIFR